MTAPIKPWLSQAEAQRIFCELADANLLAAQRQRERDILQHALDSATARIAELEAEREEAWNTGYTEGYNEAYEKYGKVAVLAEREACAEIAEIIGEDDVAAAIRARPEP